MKRYKENLDWPALLHYYIGPLLLIVVFTVAVQFMGVLAGGPNVSWSLTGNALSWTVVGGMIVWAFASLWIPSKIYYGPTTSFGFSPAYSANGLQFFGVSVAVHSVIMLIWPHTATLIADNFPQILAANNILAFVLCLYLLAKGKFYPQIKEVMERKPIMFEFYRGMEVHPRLLGVDVKQLTNCRFGLMAWQLLIGTFFVNGWVRHGFQAPSLVCFLLQTIYLAKFFWWETGYFNTLDITLDRAGYYICWGCIVLVPSLYTFHSYYMSSRVSYIGPMNALIILIFGMFSTAMNYRVDWEKEHFRNTKGECVIWGKKPTYIIASYKSPSSVKQSKLLTSGSWGVARHLNYTFEILLAFSWALPGLGHGIWPFIYPMFLTILLVHRIYRDEEKCRHKYGKYWVEYCKKVPYRMIPGIY